MDPITAGAMLAGGTQLIGGALNADSAKKAARRNAAAQKEYAQNSIQWRVDDAKKAGIHPLFALGASSHSFAPSYVGDASMGDSISNMGQNIGRAIEATGTQADREFNNQMRAQQLKNAQLQNTLLEGQITSINQALNPPAPGTPTFIPGQTSSGIAEVPMERLPSHPDLPGSDPGAINDTGWAYTTDGALVPIPSKDVKERIEDILPHEIAHFIRNNVAPNLGKGAKPPRSALPKGYSDWQWSMSKQAYIPVKKKFYKTKSGRRIPSITNRFID